MEIVDFFTFFIRQSVNQACTYKNGESLDFTSTVTFTESSDNFLHFFVAEMRKPLYRETPQLKCWFTLTNRLGVQSSLTVHWFYVTTIQAVLFNFDSPCCLECVFFRFSIQVYAKTSPKHTWIYLNLDRILTISSFYLSEYLRATNVGFLDRISTISRLYLSEY